MASNQGHAQLAKLERMREEMRGRFKRAHEVLHEREAALLLELQELERIYEWKGVADQIHQLSISKEQLVATLKGNQNQHILEQSVVPIEARIKELELTLETVDNIEFDWDSKLVTSLGKIGSISLIGEISELKIKRECETKSSPAKLENKISFRPPEQLCDFSETSDVEEREESNEKQELYTEPIPSLELGDSENEILDSILRVGKDEKPDYNRKNLPVLLACNRSDLPAAEVGMFAYLNSIELDPRNGNIYVSDGELNNVRVFNKSFQLLFTFNEEMHVPEGICINQNKVYITQLLSYSVKTYTIDGRLLRSVGKKGTKKLEFNFPCGIAVSNTRGLIYICDAGNDRVQCLNMRQKFHSFISDIPSPRDVKLTPCNILLLTSESLRLYNISHQLVRNVIPCGVGELAVKPLYFCLDRFENILMTDSATHCVLVFSMRGELMHKFGRKGKAPGEFIEPSGIALDAEGRIIVATDNPGYLIQIF